MPWQPSPHRHPQLEPRKPTSIRQRVPSTGSKAAIFRGLVPGGIAVVNAELRFPLIRALVIGPIGFPPIEGVAFYDAGVAWDNNSSPVFQRGANGLEPDERGILTSAGVGARINLLGIAVLEVDYVNPIDAARGWHWQFSLQPGF